MNPISATGAEDASSLLDHIYSLRCLKFEEFSSAPDEAFRLLSKANIAALLNLVRDARLEQQSHPHPRIENGEKFVTFLERFSSGSLSVPDPFGRDADTATTRDSLVLPSPNWSSVPIYVYRFSSKQVFFVFVTGQSECRINGVFFPALNLFVHDTYDSHDFLISLPKALLSFIKEHASRISDYLAKPDRSTGLVFFNEHFAHHIWNELSAVSPILESFDASKLTIFVRAEPVGPIDNVVPELAKAQTVSLPMSPLDASLTLLRNGAFCVPLGRCWIPAQLRDRIIAVASDRYPYDLKKAQAFKDRHPLVLWVSVRTGVRVCLNQVELIIKSISHLTKKYDSLGVIFDGFTFGLGAPRKFGSVQNEVNVIKKVIDGTDGNIEAVYLNGSELPLSFLWCTAADFYLADHGTIQHKIGWFADVPGIVHAPQTEPDLLQSTPGVFARENSIVPRYVYGSVEQSATHRQRFDRRSYTIDIDEFSSILDHEIQSCNSRRAPQSRQGVKSLAFVNSQPTNRETEDLLQQAARAWSGGSREDAFQIYASGIAKDFKNLRLNKAMVTFLLLNYLAQSSDNSHEQQYYGHRYLIAENPSNSFLFEQFVLSALTSLDESEAYKEICLFAVSFQHEPDLFGRIKNSIGQSHTYSHSEKVRYSEIIDNIVARICPT